MNDSIFEWMEQVRLVDRVLYICALLGPLLIASLAGLLRRNDIVLRRRHQWVLAALTPPAVLLLWTIYNAVIERWGLDSVRGLLVNVLVFIAAACAAVALHFFLLRTLSPDALSTKPAEASQVPNAEATAETRPSPEKSIEPGSTG